MIDYMTCDPKYLHFHALNMWANYIETGDVIMSATDAVNCGQKEDVKVLDDNQKRFVLRLRDEATTTIQKGM